MVAQIPEKGLHREIEAVQAVRIAVGDVGGLREVLSVQCSFDVTPKSCGRFNVAGHWQNNIIAESATVGCVKDGNTEF